MHHFYILMELNILRELKQLRQTTCYPFLLHVFKDFQDQRIDEKTLTSVLSLITTYLIRRSICNVPTNSLNISLCKSLQGSTKQRKILRSN